MPLISSIVSPEPQIVTTYSDSNEPTMPYGYGRQLPIIPPNLNDLNLQHNPFKILATMAVANHEHDDNYSPNHRSLQNSHRYRRPHECQHL